MKWLSTGVKHHLARVLSVLGSILVLGAAVSPVFADTFVQSFNSVGSLQNGWVVTLTKNNSDTVEAASSNGDGTIYGVVIDPSLAPLTVQRQGQQIFVASSGDYPVLVSTQDGAIQTGDYLSVSSTAGIAAKSSSVQTFVLGQALQSFDGKSGVITTQAGGTAIGRIMVNVNPGKNPLIQNDVAIPAPLKNLSQSIAGRPVSALHIYAALAIFLTSALIAASLLWVGVRSGMIAIGRNPLSRHSIIRSLSQVVVMAALIFIAGLLGVYLLLRL